MNKNDVEIEKFCAKKSCCYTHFFSCEKYFTLFHRFYCCKIKKMLSVSHMKKLPGRARLLFILVEHLQKPTLRKICLVFPVFD